MKPPKQLQLNIKHPVFPQFHCSDHASASSLCKISVGITFLELHSRGEGGEVCSEVYF